MDNIKKIISKFINKDILEITDETIIDKSVINGSILVHRLYSELNKIGVEVHDYKTIRTFGDLLSRINAPIQDILNDTDNKSSAKSSTNDSNLFVRGIGIDIEKISNFPLTDDFREDKFYTNNFTVSEISYCILKQNPYQSFASIFSLKEAIYKSNNSILDNKQFNNLEILYNTNGAPELKGFILSSSHTDDTVISVSISI